MVRGIVLQAGLAAAMLGMSFGAKAGTAAPDAADPVEPKRVAVKANGLEFPTLIWGPKQGRAVMLLHGFPQEARTWSRIAAGLAKAGFRVVAFDQRGYASTARPSDAASYNFDQFTADVIAVADACKLRRFDVAGFGMGAAEAWMLGARHPDRIRSIVALRFPHPAAFARGIRSDPAQAASWAKLRQSFGEGSTEDRARRMLADNASELRKFLEKSGLPQPWLDSYVNRLREPGALAGALTWEQAVSLDEFAAVPPVTVPAYYLWSVGPALTESTARATGEYVKGGYRLEQLQGTGHFMLETASQTVLDKMLAFYRDTPP